MSSPLEEQSMEIEALESIYADDFTLLQEANQQQSQQACFDIRLTPTTDTESDQNYVAVTLRVTYTVNYPNEAPNLDLHSATQLTQLQNDELMKLAESTANADLGQVSIFNVCEAIKEWLFAHNQPQLSMFEQMQNRQDEKDKQQQAKQKLNVEDENDEIEASPLGIAPNTLVTVESFAEWKKLFDAEEVEIKAKQQKQAIEENKLTGKQLFIRGLASDLQDSEADAMKEENTTTKNVGWFNSSVFDEEEFDENTLNDELKTS